MRVPSQIEAERQTQTATVHASALTNTGPRLRDRSPLRKVATRPSAR